MPIHPLAANLSPEAILLFAVVVLLMFGGKKIPELAKGLGEGIKNFKEASKETAPSPPPPPAPSPSATEARATEAKPAEPAATTSGPADKAP